VVWPGKLLADSNFFIFFIYFNKIYIKILCYNNHAHTSLNYSSDTEMADIVPSVATWRIGQNMHYLIVAHLSQYMKMRRHSQNQKYIIPSGEDRAMAIGNMYRKYGEIWKRGFWYTW